MGEIEVGIEVSSLDYAISLLRGNIGTRAVLWEKMIRIIFVWLK